MGLSIDEKLLEKAFNISTELKVSGDRKVCDGIYIEDIAVIKYSDTKQIIHEALKKQREICAEQYAVELKGYKHFIYLTILNAPEPELGE